MPTSPMRLQLLILWSTIVAVISLGGYFLYTEVNGCCISNAQANGGQGEGSFILFMLGIFLFGGIVQESLIIKKGVPTLEYEIDSIESTIVNPTEKKLEKAESIIELDTHELS